VSFIGLHTYLLISSERGGEKGSEKNSLFSQPAQQSPLARGEPWTLSSGRYIHDRLDLQPRKYPEDEGRDGHRNAGFFTFQPLDPADSQRELIILNCQERTRSYI